MRAQNSASHFGSLRSPPRRLRTRAPHAAFGMYWCPSDAANRCECLDIAGLGAVPQLAVCAGVVCPDTIEYSTGA